MVRFVQRDALAGPAAPRHSAALESGSADPAGAAVFASPGRLDAAERERRGHIRRWAALMIVHLERDAIEDPEELDDALAEVRHHGYVEALERLRALIDRELGQVRGAAGAVGQVPAREAP